MEHSDPVIQLDRRSRGLAYNRVAVENAHNNGLGVGRSMLDSRISEFPNYDGTDTFDQRSEYQPKPEVVTDPDTMLEWLTIAGEKVTDLEALLEQGRLTKADFDPELVTIVETIVIAEQDKNHELNDEHPEWTQAIDSWFSRDIASYKQGDIAEDVAFYEDLVADISSEMSSYEQELYYWTQFNENQPRREELASGLEYYEGLLEVSNHRRIAALATMSQEALERLYALAA